jgi:hypothetical protein
MYLSYRGNSNKNFAKVTINHLNGINAILKEGESVKHVNKVRALFVEVREILRMGIRN